MTEKAEIQLTKFRTIKVTYRARLTLKEYEHEELEAIVEAEADTGENGMEMMQHARRVVLANSTRALKAAKGK